MTSRHPSGAELQQYVDGELGSLRSHVENCPVCQAETSAIRQSLEECAQLSKHILPGYAPPPRPWADIYQRIAESEQVSQTPWFFRNVKAWAVAAALAVLAAGLFLRFRETPTVQAAELLRKAVAAAKPPSKPQRLLVRTRTQQFVRPAGSSGASTVNSVQAQFQAARFDWNNPLTAQAHLTWSEQLPEKRDEVTRERDVYRIRTETSSSDLMAATLTLRVEDLQPVAARFDFRNRDWVELSEAPADDPANTIAPITRPSDPKLETKAVPALPAPSVAPATLGDELRVFVALHRIGADLGDPIEIARSSGEVRVTGAGIPVSRQQQIREAVTALPAVSLDFSQPQMPKLEPRNRVAGGTGPRPDISLLQARIAEQIGGREQFDDVAARILDLSEKMMARAYALRRLAEHFPAAQESELSSEDEQLLGVLRSDHLASLHQTVAQIDTLLKPVLSAVSGTSQASGRLVLAGAWQPAAEKLFLAARRIDRLSAVMFGNAPDENPGQNVPAQLLATVSELRIALENK